MSITADPVPAITEAGAQGQTAEIFEDIRQTLGVNVVNLVWRHLATFDGGLPWAWSCVRPAYISGAVAAEAEQMKQALSLAQLPEFTSDVLAAAGVDSEAMTRIRSIQASYDRSNAMNFLALSALASNRADYSSATAGASSFPSVMEQAIPLGPLPPLPPLDAMSPELLSLLQGLNQLGQTRDDAIMVSMYRQLSYWPGYLSLIWALIAPLAASGQLQRLVSSAEETVQPHVRALAVELASMEGPPEARAALRDFLDRVNLPKMIVITRMLMKALPAEHSSWRVIAPPLP